MKENVKKLKKKFYKFFSKNQQKNVKMSGSKSTDKINKKIEKMHFCTAYIKIGNPKENTMCEYSSKIKKSENSCP